MISVGVDLGGTKSLAIRLEDGEIVDQTRIVHGSSAETIAEVLGSARSVMTDDVEAIGVGVAGLVRPSDGTLVWGPHVPGINLRIGDAVSAEFGLPVAVDNDANTSCYAELRLGAAQGYTNALFVSLGTGIGGAIVIDGSIYRGSSGFAGEWGHMTVEPSGLLCDCGRRGCWETRASGPALVRLARGIVSTNPASSLARNLGGEVVTGEAVVAIADGGDETARGLVTEVGRWFGTGLAGLVSVFDPELVVVGGGLGSVGESILGPARRMLADSIHGGKLRVPPALQVASLGPAAGAVGAALLAEGSAL